MKKTLITIAIVLAIITVKAQTERVTKKYLWAGQLAFELELFENNTIGVFIEGKATYRQPKQDVCSCTKPTTLPAITAGATIHTGEVTFKVGGGAEREDKIIPLATLAIGGSHFELAVTARLQKEKANMQFNANYLFSLSDRKFKRFGIGAGYDLDLKIFMGRILFRFPINFSTACKTCGYDN
jgi:hypothetical protein